MLPAAPAASPGPRRAAAHPRPADRPQHGRSADAARRAVRTAAAPPGQARATQKTVTDLVKRQFTADGPNRLWVTGITEHPAREGKVYCCVVIDVLSRRVAGWAIDTAQRAGLATSALGMAIDSRRPSPGAIIHGDHGAQFTSWAFTTRAKNAGLLPSLGTVGDPLRQRSRRVILGTHAGRAPEPAAAANAGRARKRDLRVHRRLPQPPTTPQLSRLGITARVRNRAPQPGHNSSRPIPVNRGMINSGPRRCARRTAADSRTTTRIIIERSRATDAT